MKRLIVLLALVGAMFTMTPSTALAQVPDIEATVTPSFISISVSLGNLNYGVLGLGDTGEPTLPSPQACATATGPAFTVTNNGTAAETFNVTGFDSTPGGWLLAGAAAENEYVHSFEVDPGGGGPCTFGNDLTTSSQSLSTNVLKDDSVDTYLQLGMPTASTNANGNDAQTLKMTITAITFVP